MELAQLEAQIHSALSEAATSADLEATRVQFLGKKGALTEALKSVGRLPHEERAQAAAGFNQLKASFQKSLAEKQAHFAHLEQEATLLKETLDVSLPGRSNALGTEHPISQMVNKIQRYFQTLGFEISEGPEIEDIFYNFSALNIPEDHPARTLHDTFYLEDSEERVLRTHTSPIQIRAMQGASLPLRLIAPGRVYRCDSDPTHSPMFHQVECLMVDKGLSFGHLKGILQDFLRYLFEKDDLTIRLRPSYFPFTEPSAEVDMACVHCTKASRDDCRVCGATGWLEVLGCGMVHPNVFNAVDIDPTEWQGFAFGMGVERLAMLYFGIDDLRVLFANDLRVLSQF